MDLVQLMLFAGEKSLLKIESSDGDACLLLLDDGRMVNALQGEFEGREAFSECMGFSAEKIADGPRNEPSARTIDEAADFLRMEATRRRDEMWRDSRNDEEFLENKEPQSTEGVER